jgi:hypothetical protein
MHGRRLGRFRVPVCYNLFIDHLFEGVLRRAFQNQPDNKKNSKKPHQEKNESSFCVFAFNQGATHARRTWAAIDRIA